MRFTVPLPRFWNNHHVAAALHEWMPSYGCAQPRDCTPLVGTMNFREWPASWIDQLRVPIHFRDVERGQEPRGPAECAKPTIDACRASGAVPHNQVHARLRTKGLPRTIAIRCALSAHLIASIPSTASSKPARKNGGGGVE